MNLEDVVMLFHNPDLCGGIITSAPTGQLVCAICGAGLGLLDPDILRQLIETMVRPALPQRG